MPVIDGITIDVEWWTNQETESDPRNRAIDFAQPHHTAYPSLNGSRALMDEGGRTVSANGLLDTDGTLYGVVLPGRRAYTSASAFDHRCFTVEMVNASGAPNWELTEAQHKRMGQLLAELAALRDRSPGMDMIVPHNEVPGSYATACPGPSFSKQKMLDYALNNKGGSRPVAYNSEEETMKLIAQRFTDGRMANVLDMPFAATIVNDDDWAAAIKAHPGLPIVEMNQYDYESYSRNKSIGERAMLAAIDSTMDPDQAELLAAIKAIKAINTSPGDALPDAASFSTKLLTLLGPALAQAVAQDLRARLNQ